MSLPKTAFKAEEEVINCSSELIALSFNSSKSPIHFDGNSSRKLIGLGAEFSAAENSRSSSSSFLHQLIARDFMSFYSSNLSYN